jgi:hypothetical protein
MDGPGIGVPKYKDIDRLGDKFIEVRDEKAELAGKLTKIEGEIAELMADKGISKYRFADQEVILKPGKTHVKIKTVKAEGVDGGIDDPDDE